MQTPEVTILVPVFNEEDNVVPLVRSIRAVVSRVGLPYETLIVDDGSTDATVTRLEELEAEEPALRVIRLRRNFGQTAALAAGFDHARGRYIVTLDGDLQNDPEDIPTVLGLLEEGYDLVSGWRRDRKDRFLSRRLPSKIANALLSDLTGVRVHDFGCTLKGYRASLVKSLPVYSEMHRYMPALAGSVGARITEVVVRHHPRRAGKSKYGIGRTLRVLYDLMALRVLTRFAARPLHWFGVGSLPVFLVAFAMLPLTFVDHRTGSLVEFSTLIFPAVVILLVYLGVHFLMIGLLAELAVHVMRGSPSHVVRLDDAAGGRR